MEQFFEFEQHCVPLNSLLNQVELADQRSFTGLNDTYFNFQCISNVKHLFSETL